MADLWYQVVESRFDDFSWNLWKHWGLCPDWCSLSFFKSKANSSINKVERFYCGLPKTQAKAKQMVGITQSIECFAFDCISFGFYIMGALLFIRLGFDWLGLEICWDEPSLHEILCIWLNLCYGKCCIRITIFGWMYDWFLYKNAYKFWNWNSLTYYVPCSSC